MVMKAVLFIGLSAFVTALFAFIITRTSAQNLDKDYQD
jgi:hypothetical protein